MPRNAHRTFRVWWRDFAFTVAADTEKQADRIWRRETEIEPEEGDDCWSLDVSSMEPPTPSGLIRVGHRGGDDED